MNTSTTNASPASRNYFTALLDGFDLANQAQDFPFEAQFVVGSDGNASKQITRPIPSELKSALSEQTQEFNEAVIATGFALLLAKHVNHQDVVIGCAPETDQVLPLRCNFGESDALASIKDQLFHSRGSFKSLDAFIDALEENERRECFRFLLTDCPLADVKTGAKNGAILALFPNMTQGFLQWSYDPELLGGSIDLIHERFCTLLQQLLDGTARNRDLLSLSMIGANEQQKLDELSHGSKRAVRSVGYAELIEEQAKRVPNNLAVKDINGGMLSYKQLNRLADLLAVQLESRLTGTPNPRIAVMMPRTTTLFVSLLAALKMGGCYVPINPSYPAERIEYIVKDSGCELIITAAEFQPLMPASLQDSAVLYEDAMEAKNLRRTSLIKRTKPAFSEDDVMLVLYTSGTTGKPKGVEITNRSAMYFIQNTYWDCITSSDVWAQMANPCFIGSMNDIWLPLVKGAASVVLPKEIMLDTTVLRETLDSQNISCLFLTPKVLEMIADIDASLFDGLKLVQFAGEAVRLDAVQKLAGGPKYLQHLYGCTERMGCISGFDVPATTKETATKRRPEIARLPIGQPIENTQCYVLDANKKPVPLGMSGELYVGGPQIARGYINRDDATAEKFLPNPFDEGKMYRTGDLARWLPDGRGLDLAGRIDSLVKVNGYRIELGEIEASIMEETSLEVTGAVVITTDTSSGKMITAYVTPEAVDTVMLQTRLADKLPSYMQPNHITTIPIIPLTPNGKLDRRALPSAETSNKKRPYVPPTTESELFVVDVWSRLLDVEKVSITDHFLELGGHSLMVPKVLAMLKERCAAIQVADLLECTTPQETALRMDELLAMDTCWVELPECVVKFSRNQEDMPGVHPVWCIHGGSGLVDWSGGFNKFMETRPLFGIQMTQEAVETGKKHEEGYFHGLCQYYAEAIRAVQPHGPYKLAGNSLGALIAFEIAYILEQSGEEVEQLISMDMPSCKFNKMEAYRTATSIHEKAPGLLAYTFGEFFCKDKEVLAKELDIFMAALDKEILAPASDENAAFVTMQSTFTFLRKMGMGEAEIQKMSLNLSCCADLFVDLIGRGNKINADILCTVATDNRLMVHTLKASGLEHMIEDYGWTNMTHGKVEMIPVFGNHVDMVSTQSGMKTFGEALDAIKSMSKEDIISKRASFRRSLSPSSVAEDDLETIGELDDELLDISVRNSVRASVRASVATSLRRSSVRRRRSSWSIVPVTRRTSIASVHSSVSSRG